MKLSFWTIIIMAISVAFAILSFALLHQYLPTKTAIENYNQYKTQLETEASKKKGAQDRVKAAQRAVAEKASAWNAYAAVRTPEADLARGGMSLNQDPYQLTVDTQKFRNSIQRAVNEQVKKGGIVVVGNGPYVRGPASTDDPSNLLAEYYNYPGIKFPVVLFDFGTVTVSGTYEQIRANIRSYKTMPHYLAVTDGLRISGTSPHLIGTYNLSIVGFIRGKEIFPSIAGAGAAGGAPALGGPPQGFGGPGGPGSLPPGVPGRPSGISK